VRNHLVHGPRGGAAGRGSPVDGKRCSLQVEHRGEMNYLMATVRGRGITGNVGPHRGGGKEGGPVAFVGGEARLMVTDSLTTTLQLQGMAVDIRH
jgi:hypothetical protein